MRARRFGVALLLLGLGQSLFANAANVPATLPARSFGNECASFGALPPPFTHSYMLRGGGKIVFVAVAHGSDPRSPTFTQIRDAIGQSNVAFVLVEGASSAKSASDAYLRYLSDTATRRLAEGKLGENLYAVKLSDDKGIKFAGWDLSPDQLYGDSVRNGFALPDIIGAHLLRSKVDPFDPKSAPQIQAELRYAAQYGDTSSFDYATWYKTMYGMTVDLTAGTPCGPGVASKIVKYETKMRNENLVSVLQSLAGTSGTIVIEAGAAHWLALNGYLASISNKTT